jgi:plastocyanin
MRKISIVLVALLVATLAAKSAPAGDNKGGVLKGKVTFSGNNADANKTDNTAKDPDACGPSRSLDKLKVDAGKGVEDVVVYVKGKVPGDFDAKFKKVELDQKGCVFHSHVTFVAAGGDVVFKNSDTVLHNVKFSSTNNGSFNQGIGGGKEQSYTFKEPEFVTCECSVHPWMSGLIVVMENPYYTATNDKGEYELHLPAGKQKIMMQHQTLGKAEKKGVEVEIKDGETKTLDFEFK